MAYISFQPSDYFNTVLYTGNASTNAVTGVGFQPDWLWVKSRSRTDNHRLMDSLRGTYSIMSNNTDFQRDVSGDGFTSLDSDGFTLNGSGGGGEFNASSATYVSWNWKANGSGSANTDGTISSTVSANTTAGFSIAQWTGTGSNATIGHGLGATPKCFIMKKTSGTSAWSVYHETVGNTKFMTLNATSDPTVSSTVFNNTSPTSSVFSVGVADNGNASGATYIGYFFAEKKGFSKFGSYTGNGSTDGTFVYLGFRPAWILVKRTDTSGWNWNIWDSKRLGYNGGSPTLFADLSNSEDTEYNRMDQLSNGFKCRINNGQLNASGGTYIYMAFAEHPLVSSNDIPATAR